MLIFESFVIEVINLTVAMTDVIALAVLTNDIVQLSSSLKPVKI